MNPSHVAVGGLGAGTLAPVLMWVTDWPIKPLTEPTAMALASLLLAGGALLYSLFRKPQGV